MRRFLLPLLILFFSLGCGGADVPGMEQLDLPKQDDTSPSQDVDTLAPSDRLKNDVRIQTNLTRRLKRTLERLMKKTLKVATIQATPMKSNSLT